MSAKKRAISLNPESKSYSSRSAWVLLLVGVLAGVTVGGGVGVVAASSTKSVRVCANKKTNILRYAKSGKCAKSETKLVLLVLLVLLVRRARQALLVRMALPRIRKSRIFVVSMERPHVR